MADDNDKPEWVADRGRRSASLVSLSSFSIFGSFIRDGLGLP
ncbi:MULTISPECIES: hypothetical protein [unclassified Microbacterium]|nr:MULTISPECIES: hypothetical protein [unclassified Microbacterium]